MSESYARFSNGDYLTPELLNAAALSGVHAIAFDRVCRGEAGLLLASRQANASASIAFDASDGRWSVRELHCISPRGHYVELKDAAARDANGVLKVFVALKPNGARRALTASLQEPIADAAELLDDFELARRNGDGRVEVALRAKSLGATSDLTRDMTSVSNGAAWALDRLLSSRWKSQIGDLLLDQLQSLKYLAQDTPCEQVAHDVSRLKHRLLRFADAVSAARASERRSVSTAPLRDATREWPDGGDRLSHEQLHRLLGAVARTLNTAGALDRELQLDEIGIRPDEGFPRDDSVGKVELRYTLGKEVRSVRVQFPNGAQDQVDATYCVGSERGRMRLLTGDRIVKSAAATDFVVWLSIRKSAIVLVVGE